MAITGITQEQLTPQYRQFKIAEELTNRFNSGDLDYLPKKDLEKIAMLAAQHGTDFKPRSKPFRKGLFDFVDTALFGMVPNKWRPTTVGEEYFGESAKDKLAGGIGTVAGLPVFGAGLYKGAQLAGKSARNLWGMARGGAKGGGGTSGPINKIGSLNQPRDRILIGGGTRQLPNVPRQLPNVPRQISGTKGYLPNYINPTTPGFSQTLDIMKQGGGYAF